MADTMEHILPTELLGEPLSINILGWSFFGLARGNLFAHVVLFGRSISGWNYKALCDLPSELYDYKSTLIVLSMLFLIFLSLLFWISLFFLPFKVLFQGF